MRVLLTNDDGILGEGLEAMVAELDGLAEVWVVAPDRERSATGRAISLGRPLRLRRLEERRWTLDGTPVDCVVLGLGHLLRERAPDLLVSGVNAGPNLASDVMYSGTVGAAMEGCHQGVPSLAVSSVGTSLLELQVAARFAAGLVRSVAERGLAPGVLLNVNVPRGFPPDGGGRWQVTTLGRRRYGGGVRERSDPRGKPYYWVGGPPVEDADLPGSDCNAIRDGAASVTPLHLDLTHAASIPTLQGWELDGRTEG